MELNKEELLQIRGGASITGSLITALVRGITSLLELGRSLGTSIRRLGEDSMCPLELQE